ncbi:hypothetical protein B296_00047496 [Ensete ventricosum]|uniref:Uncharacterized protein n=1 Tax=Ensete ventricosum TaxID=4639 RepID=A0A426XIW2_ENSVE|nr:hypothetical protein B296_00047496 [Ensete ventricosum]
MEPRQQGKGKGKRITKSRRRLDREVSDRAKAITSPSPNAIPRTIPRKKDILLWDSVRLKHRSRARKVEMGLTMGRRNET